MPSTEIDPALGWLRPPRIARNVLLPEPDCPITPRNEPSGTTRSRPRRACTGAPSPAKVFCRPRTSMKRAALSSSGRSAAGTARVVSSCLVRLHGRCSHTLSPCGGLARHSARSASVGSSLAGAERRIEGGEGAGERRRRHRGDAEQRRPRRPARPRRAPAARRRSPPCRRRSRARRRSRRRRPPRCSTSRVICACRKPMARNTPISVVRSLTEPIMVRNTTRTSMPTTTPTIARLKPLNSFTACRRLCDRLADGRDLARWAARPRAGARPGPRMRPSRRPRPR